VREVKNSEVTVYAVACELLDIEHSRCSNYEKRLTKVPSCHKLTPANVPRYNWLPESCAYRRIHRGESLPAWHPLLAGSRQRMRKKGLLVSGYAQPAHEVPRRKMQQNIIARWKV